MWAKMILDRVLLTHENHYSSNDDGHGGIQFVGLSSAFDYGGDGSAEWALTSYTFISKPMGDYADPYSTLAFLSCTFNATTQLLHPAILATLFHDPANPEKSDLSGIIPWNYPHAHKTPYPKLYVDGTSNPEFGPLIMALAAEIYVLMDACDALLSPAGMCTISSTHGGGSGGSKSSWGKYMLEQLTKNHPRDLGVRSGVTEAIVQREHALLFSGGGGGGGANSNDDGTFHTFLDEKKKGGDDMLEQQQPRTRFHYPNILQRFLCHALRHDARLAHTLAPAEPVVVVVVDDDNKNEKKKKIRYIQPKTNSSIFSDAIPNGLCIYLGLGEMLGMTLERDMPQTLAIVRKIQRWMGKEYVLPSFHHDNLKPNQSTGGKKKEGKRIWMIKQVVKGARDIKETTAPQAFDIYTLNELKDFLDMNPFAENKQTCVERNLRQCQLVSRL